MIADLEPYPVMKDSGVPWLGQVPGHWEVRRLKNVLRERDARSATGTEQLLRVSQYTGVTERNRADGLAEPDTRAESLVGYKRAEPGELVVNIMLAWNGSMGVSPFAGIASPAYCVYRFGPGTEPWYFHHLLRSPAYKARIKAVSTGVVESRLRLYTDDLYRLEALFPPLPEQAAIVRFLDHADRRIRRYIRAKQKLIKLLEEQKQAIIHRAVTRGLDPDVRLKPSGVEWLGDVPEHWEVVALRRRWTVTDCKHLTVPFVDDGIPLASVREAQSFELSFASSNRTTPEWYEKLIEGGRKPGVGDLIYCRNVGVGAAALVTTEDAFAMGQDVCLIRSERENQRWLNYFLRSGVMADQLAMILVGSTFNRINVADIKALLVAVPPRPEQDEVARHLDAALSEIDAAIEVCRREQVLLREYRTRLIADVVTGKLDVREAAARLPDEADESELLDETDAMTHAEEAASGELDVADEEVEA